MSQILHGTYILFGDQFKENFNPSAEEKHCHACSSLKCGETGESF